MYFDGEQKDWEILADGKCPLCRAVLIESGKYHICVCDFQIHTDRMMQIQKEQQNQRLPAELRRKLEAGKKVRFKGTKIFTGERPDKIDLGF